MTEKKIEHCSFCGKHKNSVGTFIVGEDVAICNTCVEGCDKLIKNKQGSGKLISSVSIPDPHEIKEYLDQHVIGQDSAKVVLSVAITNHYKRISNSNNDIDKANILIVGPTGTGKTLLASTIAKYLNVPFVVADATTLTEAGYVGDDVESVILRLYQNADSDIERTQRGIIFLDEVDKIARKSESATVSRDVSGEGVQQALLKLIEGTKIKISPSGGRRSETTVEIDTTNILFIAGGAFVGLDGIIKSRLQGTTMGFSADIAKSEMLENNFASPDDLVKYGMIPEFVGRFSNLVSLHGLTKEQLISILTDVKHNYVGQYQWLFNQDGVELNFEKESLSLIAERTLKTKTGARGLHTELERILLPHMFDLPKYRKQSILSVAITSNLVNKPETLARENE
jgi:ATP-dependent Clp protease ATP-binding subunit ClpX